MVEAIRARGDVLPEDFRADNLPDLRPKQAEGLQAIWNFLEYKDRGYIHHPTGYGKTRLMMEVAGNYGGRHVWITPGIELVAQTKNAILERNPDADVGTIDGTSKDYGHQTTVITPDSLDATRRRSSSDIHSERVLRSLTPATLVLVDEIHHFLTPKREYLLNLFPYAVMIGATATDKYSEKKNVERKFGPLIHEVTIEEAIEEGALTHLRPFLTKTGQSLDKIRSSLTNNGIDFNVRDIEKYLDLESRDMLGLEAYRELIAASHKRRPAIAFCITREHAREFAERSRSYGFPSDVMTGETGLFEREKMWHRLESGQTEIIAAVNVLNESINKPWIEVGILLRPTRSELLARQRVGRLLRQSPGTGKQFAYTIELFDDLTEKGSHAPITVPNLFNAHQFRNGGVITDRYGKYEGQRMLDGVPVGDEIQISPTYDGVLGRVESLQYNMDLANPESVDEVRNELRTLLTSGGWGERDIINIQASNLGGRFFWQGNKPVSLVSLVRKFTGSKRPNISSEEYVSFLNFVFGKDEVASTRKPWSPNNSKVLSWRQRQAPLTPEKEAGSDQKITEKEDSGSGENCTHHWVIGGSNGTGEALGRCNHCGGQKTFRTIFEGFDWNARLEEDNQFVEEVKRGRDRMARVADKEEY